MSGELGRPWAVYVEVAMVDVCCMKGGGRAAAATVLPGRTFGLGWSEWAGG